MAEEKPTPKVIKKGTRVMDITTPGKPVPSATSKPVIVGHTNTINADPILSNSDSDKIEIQTEAPETSVSQEPEVEAPKAEEQPQAATNEVAEEPSKQAETEVEEEVAPAENAEQSSDNDTNEADTESSAVIDEIAGNVTLSKDRQDKEMAEMQASEQIQKMINSKKYYVKTKSPDSVSNFRWLVFLVGILILAAALWYFLVGPGKGMINLPKKTTTPTPQATAPVAASNTQANPTPKQPIYKDFNETKSNLNFSYLDTWKVTSAPDTKFPEKNLITLISPVENLNVSTATSPSPVDAEVFLRAKIYQENTTDTKKYKNELINMKNCSSEDIIITNTPLQFIYLSFAQPDPYVTRTALASDVCQKSGTLFNSNDKIQLSTKKNTYVIYAEYVYSDAYLLKNGTAQRDIALAQENGVSMKLENYKQGKNLAELKKILTTSLKEK